ncbi:MAG: septum formation initiator family protein [Lachnospiraceae bacterium]|nr:septum formation initiator family protein [Lachnospiraceae bacterium]
MARYGKKKKRKQNRLAMFGITVVVIAMLCVLGYQTVLVQQKSDQYADRLASVERQLAEQEVRAADLEAQRIYTQTKQYIEQEAKAKLGLVNPNEIILIPTE